MTMAKGAPKPRKIIWICCRSCRATDTEKALHRLSGTQAYMCEDCLQSGRGGRRLQLARHQTAQRLGLGMPPHELTISEGEWARLAACRDRSKDPAFRVGEWVQAQSNKGFERLYGPRWWPSEHIPNIWGE